MADMAKIHTIDSNIIVHDGKQYRKVDRPVREGDAFIIPKESGMDYTAGKVYAITEIDSDGYPHFIDDVGDRYYLLSDDYYVLEPVAADLSALESELAAMKAKVAEMERQLAEAKVADRLKVGDYVKIGPVRPGVFSEGEYGEVIGYDHSDVPYIVKSLDSKKTAWFREETLIRATDEEVAEAKRKLAEKENADKWAAIGRKPGEFKTGDVVRLLDDSALAGEASAIIKRGDLGTLGEEGAFGNFRFMFRGVSSGNWVSPKRIELVAPVESVVNLRGGDVA
jgi:hypothetical protein